MFANRFFCVSYFEGNLDLLKYADNKFMVYFKGDQNREKYEAFPDENKVWIKNSGYNISAYLRFIVDYYDDLPEITVFCKNNTYPRHVSENCFSRLCNRNVYTPIIDTMEFQRLRFPVAMLSSAGDYLEINDSWYARKKHGRFFNDFHSFFQFLFPGAPLVSYLRFGPGANVVVPRSHIALRSKSFYRNLQHFIDYEPLALESFFVERALDAIFCAPFEENPVMSSDLDDATLSILAESCKRTYCPPTNFQRGATRFGYTISRWINSFTGNNT